MTIFYPDVSNFQGSMAIAPGTVAVCAKVSESTTYADPTYAHFKSAAAGVGALFSAYHFLHAGNGYAQGQYAGRLAGSVPLMIDSEPTSGSNPSVQDNLDFVSGVHSVGGKVWGSYFPAWYWSSIGGPSLAPLASAGLALVASGYTAYSDSASQWNAYGGVSPAIWQYTDSLSYSGQSVDFNAYKGTVAQLAQLWLLASSPAPAPAVKEDEDMALIISVPSGEYLLSGSLYIGIDTPAVASALSAAGVQTVAADANFHQRIVAAQAAQVTPLTEAQVQAAVAAALAANPIQVEAGSIQLPSGSLALSGSLSVGTPAAG